MHPATWSVLVASITLATTGQQQRRLRLVIIARGTVLTVVTSLEALPRPTVRVGPPAPG